MTPKASHLTDDREMLMLRLEVVCKVRSQVLKQARDIRDVTSVLKGKGGRSSFPPDSIL